MKTTKTSPKVSRKVTKKVNSVLNVKNSKGVKKHNDRLVVVKSTKKSNVSSKFKNGDGEQKQIARELMVDAIKNSNTKKGEILSLPFEDCIIEQMILNEKNCKRYKFLGVEYDKQTYYNMLKTISEKQLPINAYHGALADKIYEAKEGQYSHIIADYCGQLNTFHEEIEYAIKNNIVEVGGTISITLNKRISDGCFGIYEKIERLLPKMTDRLTIEDKYARTERIIYNFMLKVCGMNYTILTPFAYHDTTSMYLIIVKRTE